MECTPRYVQEECLSDSAALSKQHSLSQSHSSQGVTELGSSSNDDVESPLRDILSTKKVSRICSLDFYQHFHDVHL